MDFKQLGKVPRKLESRNSKEPSALPMPLAHTSKFRDFKVVVVVFVLSYLKKLTQLKNLLISGCVEITDGGLLGYTSKFRDFKSPWDFLQ